MEYEMDFYLDCYSSDQEILEEEIAWLNEQEEHEKELMIYAVLADNAA